MALVARRQNGFLISTNVDYYHHFSGLDMQTIAPLIAHFYRIIEQSPKISKSRLGSKPIIDTLICRTFNVREQKDIIVKLRNNNNRQITPIDDKFFSSNFTDLHFSSILRYFRAGSPVMHNVFGTPYLFQPCMKVFDFQAKLTKPEIIRIIDTFPHTFDLPCAIARALIFSFEKTDLINFLPELDAKYPDVLPQLLNYFSINSAFINQNIKIIKNHCQYFPEDICSTYFLLLHYLDKGKVDSAKKLIPILEGGIAVTPLAGIGLSRYATYIGRYSEALIFLNISGFSKCWPPLHKYGPARETEPRSSLLGPGKTEKALGSWPLQGPLFEMVQAISEILHAVGSHKFKDLCRDFVGSKKTPDPNIADDGSFVDLFDFLSIGNNLSLFDNDDNIAQKIDKDLLYDPGVCGSDDCVNPGELEGLEISTNFWASLKHARFLASERRKLLSSQRQIGLLTHELILAIELGDSQMASGIADMMAESRTTSGLDILLLQRAYTLGLIRASSVFAVSPTTLVQTERNALIWNGSLIERLVALNH